MSFKDWSAILGTWVSISAAILGGYLALQTYEKNAATRKEEVARQADARVIQTFALFRDWQGGDMLRVRTRMTNNIPHLQEFARAGDQELFAFIDFFDAVQICMERNLCEPELTAQLFRPYAIGAYAVLGPTIAEVRAAEKARGDKAERPAGFGMEKLASANDTTVR